MSCDDLADLGVEFDDVDLLSRVFGFDISGDGEIVVVLDDFGIGREMGKMFDLAAFGKGLDDFFQILLREAIVVRDFHEFFRRVYKEGLVVGLAFFEHQNTGGDGRAEEKIRWKLDHAVDKVVVDHVLANFLLRAASIHDAGETDDGGGAVRGEPGEAVHDKGEIGFALGREDAGGCKTRVVHKKRVLVACPFDGIGRVGDDEFERFVVPMCGVGEGVFACDIEFVKSDIV